MKKLALISALLYFTSGWAQSDSSNSAGVMGMLSYKQVGGQHFAGFTLEMSGVIIEKTHWPKVVLGTSLGMDYSPLRESLDQELNLDLIFTEKQISYNADVRGNLFLVPAELHFLIGFQEDFLEVGLIAGLSQFLGKQVLESQGTRYTYEIADFDMFAGYSIGYRHQPQGRGTCFKVLWQPVWTVENRQHDKSSFVVALGYKF